jgi:hypothetical protein
MHNVRGSIFCWSVDRPMQCFQVGRRMLPRQIPHISASKQGSMYAAPLHISAALSPDAKGRICFRSTFHGGTQQCPTTRFWTAPIVGSDMGCFQ